MDGLVERLEIISIDKLGLGDKVDLYNFIKLAGLTPILYYGKPCVTSNSKNHILDANTDKTLEFTRFMIEGIPSMPKYKGYMAGKRGDRRSVYNDKEQQDAFDLGWKLGAQIGNIAYKISDDEAQKYITKAYSS
jgi:hypothetical protein